MRRPIAYTHLRKRYVAMLKAAHRDDWDEVTRLFEGAPTQFRALAHLFVFNARLVGRA